MKNKLGFKGYFQSWKVRAEDGMVVPAVEGNNRLIHFPQNAARMLFDTPFNVNISSDLYDGNGGGSEGIIVGGVENISNNGHCNTSIITPQKGGARWRGVYSHSDDPTDINVAYLRRESAAEQNFFAQRDVGISVVSGDQIIIEWELHIVTV